MISCGTLQEGRIYGTFSSHNNSEHVVIFSILLGGQNWENHEM